MRGFRALKALKICVLVALALMVFGFVTEHLWNWLMPAIFGLKAITFLQALGLVVLSKILLGGFHKHAGGGPRGWKREMGERWARMTPEEREKFRAGMKGRRECWPGGEGWGARRGGMGPSAGGLGRTPRGARGRDGTQRRIDLEGESEEDDDDDDTSKVCRCCRRRGVHRNISEIFKPEGSQQRTRRKNKNTDGDERAGLAGAGALGPDFAGGCYACERFDGYGFRSSWVRIAAAR